MKIKKTQAPGKSAGIGAVLILLVTGQSQRRPSLGK
jgi:hypothetical protein